jgi:UDP-N-acetylglucosamine 3-dehydrogenase
MKKKKIAVIGFGAMGKNHCRVINKSSEAALVGVCDVVKPEIFDFECPFFTNPKDLLNSIEVDAVIIATPSITHFEIAEVFLDLRIPLLIEKPVTANIEEADYLIEKFQNGPKVCVGHIERFNPVVIALLDNLKNKEIYSFHLTRVGPIPPRIADAGVLSDLAVHDIDLIRYLSKSKIISHKVYSSNKKHTHYEDNAILSFLLDGEMVASITTNWLTPFKKRMIEVSSKESYFEANLITQELIEYSDFNSDHSFRLRHCNVVKSEPLAAQLTAFVNYISTGKPGNLAMLDDGRMALQFCKNI